jgi:uncharacterized protein (TIGR00255 family)
MIRSMTAFGREEGAGPWGSLVWEIRTVNHRFLDITVRMPDDLRSLEVQVRDRIQQRLARGKVDCNLRYRPEEGTAAGITLNREFARQLLAVAEDLTTMMEASTALSPADLLAWPGVVKETEPDLDAVNAATLATLDKALNALVAVREREGARLRELIEQRATAMAPLVSKARERMPVVLASMRERLMSRLAELQATLDHDRLEQEMVLLTQRLDVDEELDRLQTHIRELHHALERDEPVGRRLDFLMQELNREANTLASKSADAELTKIAIELKVLIEQMREQVQNLE